MLHHKYTHSLQYKLQVKEKRLVLKTILMKDLEILHWTIDNLIVLLVMYTDWKKTRLIPELLSRLLEGLS